MARWAAPIRAAADERKTVFKSISRILAASVFVAAFSSQALAQAGAPELVRQISVDVIETAKADKAIQAGDLSRISALVEGKVMPHVAFEVVTRSAVGPQWRQATADQRAKLQAEFKTLLIRVYSGALAQLKDQTVEVTRTQPVSGSQQVVVQTEVKGKGEPIKLDYRLDKAADAWKIIDVNVGGLWLVQNYRTQFQQELTKGGIDGLIAALVERNKAAGKS